MLPAATNIRLLMRCPVCFECAEISRDQHDKAETYCSRDNVPMTVIATAAGYFRDGQAWPEHCPCRNAGRPVMVPRTDLEPVVLPLLLKFRTREELTLVGA